MNDNIDSGTSEYPIDTESLIKGSRIAVEVIEHAFNVKRGTDEYNLAAMRARQYIERRFRDRGEIVTITQHRHDLIILTDDDMPEHNVAMFKAKIRGAARTHTRMLGGDRSKMSEETLRVHDRALTVQGAQLSALRKATREVTASVRKRETPALVAGKKG